MAGRGLSFKALLQLESKQFRQGLNNVKKQLQGFAGFVKSAFAIGSITAFGRQMVQVSKDFENAMARVKAVSNASTEDFAAMQKEAKRLGETTRYTATEAAGALENLTRNGLSAQQATKALSGVLQLAQANGIELANAADILTNTMNAFGLSVNDTTRINDVLSSTAANAATNINELHEAMVVAGPYSKIMGKSIEETAAAIGTLANNGIKGSVAGKTIAAMYQRLSAITPKAAKAMKEYGLEIDEATVKSMPLVDVLQKLSQSGIGNSVEALSNIFGKNFAGNVSQLINNFQDVDRMLGVLKNSAGTTSRMFEEGVGSVTKELDTLRSKYESLLITIGNKTSGIVKGAVRLLQNLIDNFKSVTGTLLNIASVVVPLLGKRIVAFGRTAIATFNAVKTGAVALKVAMGDIIGVVATLVTWVGTALYGAWRRETESVREAKKELKEMENKHSSVSNSIQKLIDKIGPESDPLTLAGVIEEIKRLAPEMADSLIKAVSRADGSKKWATLREKLLEIKELQDAINGSEEAGKKYDIAVGEAASRMQKSPRTNKPYWDPNIFPTDSYGFARSPMTGSIVPEDFFNRLNNILKSQGKDNDEISKVYKSLAKMLSDRGQADTLSFRDFIQGQGIFVSTEEADSLMASVSEMDVIKAAKAAGADKYIQDTTAVNTQFRKLEEDFLAELDDLNKKTKEGSDKWKVAVTELVNNFLTAVTTSIGKDKEDLLSEENRRKFNEYWAKYHFETKSGGGGGGTGDDNKLSGTSKTIKDAIDNFRTKAAELSNALREGVITEDEYETQINDLKDSTWKAIAVVKDFRDIIASFGMPDVGGWLKGDYQERQGVASSDAAYDAAANQQYQRFTQQQSLNDFKVPKMPTRDTTFDYMLGDTGKTEANMRLMQEYANTVNDLAKDLAEGIKNGDFSEVIEDAVTQLGILRQVVKDVTANANDMQHALNLSELAEKLKQYQDELKELNSQEIETYTSLVGVFERLYNAVTKISEALGTTMTDEEKEKWQNLFDVVNGGLEIFEAFKTVVEALSLAEEIASKKKAAAAAAEVTSNAMVAASNGAVAASELAKGSAEAKSAVAGAASSVAGVPGIGPALAAAAITAIAAALLANMDKFANGGFVGGNSFSGDHNLIRANSGELVLTKGQQATLFSAIKSGNFGGGGDVQFKIKGSDLVGTINNFNAKKRG